MLKDVLFSPESNLELGIDEGKSFVFEIAFDSTKLHPAYAELDIIVNSPTAPLVEKIQFNVYANDNPADASEMLETFGIEVEYNETESTWIIDFGHDVTSMLVESGQIDIYVALHNEQGEVIWGDMFNPTSEMLSSYDMTFVEPITPIDPSEPIRRGPKLLYGVGDTVWHANVTSGIHLYRIDAVCSKKKTDIANQTSSFDETMEYTLVRVQDKRISMKLKERELFLTTFDELGVGSDFSALAGYQKMLEEFYDNE